MTNCGSVLADQLVSLHQCPTIEGQVDSSIHGCPPPPLYPRVHLPPFIPVRQVHNYDCSSDPSFRGDHLPQSSCDLISTKPPLLPPRERCLIENTLSAIPVLPPRPANFSCLTGDKTSCDSTTRKLKFCKEPLPSTYDRTDKLSSRTARNSDVSGPTSGLGIEPSVLSTSPRNFKGDKRLTCLNSNTDKWALIGAKSSLKAKLDLKACPGDGMLRRNSIVNSREDGTNDSIFPNRIIPLSQWPIPVIVIPTGLPQGYNSEDRMPFQWVGPEKAVANEYVEAPSLQFPLQHILEQSDSISPSLDAFQVVTSQPTASSFVKDWRPFHSKSGELHHGDEWITFPARDLSSNGGKVFDHAPNRQQTQPCRNELICSKCKKCRCDGCRRPRRLPKTWIGPPGRQCMCSADEAVRICTCLCCVQTIFYHCFFHPDDDYDPVLDPCACCESDRCCLRWSLIAALLPLLPCLCCYCPLQCLVNSLSYCYDSCTNRGCKCRTGIREWNATADHVGAGCDRPTSSTSSSGATRDLIVDSESSSA